MLKPEAVRGVFVIFVSDEAFQKRRNMKPSKIFAWSIAALCVLLVALRMLSATHDTAKDDWKNDGRNNRTVHLAGTISGMNPKNVRVYLYGDNNRHADTLHYTIKVKHGAFSADVPLSDNEAYFLAIPEERHYSAYLFQRFFADQDTILFEVNFPKNARDINVSISNPSGNNLTYSFFKNSKDKRLEKGRAEEREYYERYVAGHQYTEEYEEARKLAFEGMTDDKALRDSMVLKYNQLILSNEHFTAEGLKDKQMNDSLTRIGLDYTREFIESQPPSLAGFLIVAESLERAIPLNHDVPFWIDTYRNVYRKKFGDCFLQQYTEDLLKKQSVYEGSKFYDFTLPDVDGNRLTLSQLIGGKPAVIEFWATWCGSCMVNREMIDKVHKLYGGEGFTVVCVANEMRNDLRWRDKLGKEEHAPGWYDLLAMEPDHYVSAEYGLGRAAGGTFVVDENGIILKISPSEEYLKQFAEDHLRK